MSDQDHEFTVLKTAAGSSCARGGHRERLDFARVLLEHHAKPIVTVVDDGGDVIVTGTIRVPRQTIRDNPLTFGDKVLMVDDGDDVVIKGKANAGG